VKENGEEGRISILRHEEKLNYMLELQNRITPILLEKLKSADDWVRVKLLIAEEIARLLVKYNDCIEKVYLVELSGGEPVDTYEGGLDIDLYIEARNCKDRLEVFGQLTEEILKESLILTKDYHFISRLKKAFRKGLEHNLIEFHVNKEYLKPLIKSRYYYKQRLYP